MQQPNGPKIVARDLGASYLVQHPDQCLCDTSGLLWCWKHGQLKALINGEWVAVPMVEGLQFALPREAEAILFPQPIAETLPPIDMTAETNQRMLETLKSAAQSLLDVIDGKVEDEEDNTEARLNCVSNALLTSVYAICADYNGETYDLDPVDDSDELFDDDDFDIDDIS